MLLVKKLFCENRGNCCISSIQLENNKYSLVFFADIEYLESTKIIIVL